MWTPIEIQAQTVSFAITLSLLSYKVQLSNGGKRTTSHTLFFPDKRVLKNKI